MESVNKNRYLSFIKKYNALMREYEELLAQEDFTEEKFRVLPIYAKRNLIIERTCAFAEDSERYAKMLTLPGQREQGLKELRDFTNSTENLIVVDPYIYSGKTAQANVLAEEFGKSIRAAGKNLKRVHIIYDPSESSTTKAIRKRMHELMKEEAIAVTEATSDVLHDRIWISDRSRATVIGTSLNGLGGKIAFILPLPSKDLINFLEYLDENALSRA